MKNTHIQWADHTFNPWIGCTKVSPGCLHCYAETQNLRWRGGANWGAGKPRALTSVSNWSEPLRWNKDCLEGEGIADDPTHPEFRRIARVFCASLADWLDPEVPIEWLFNLIGLIRKCDCLIWMLLTKRPELFFDRLVAAGMALNGVGSPESLETADFIEGWIQGRPPSNVWVGTSVEDQYRANERLPSLVRIPARIRFLSCEPLLAAIDLWQPKELADSIHWVIAGGESGSGARAMDPVWTEYLLAQCQALKIPFFMKQMGGRANKGGELESIPPNLRVREFPKG